MKQPTSKYYAQFTFETEDEETANEIMSVEALDEEDAATELWAKFNDCYPHAKHVHISHIELDEPDLPDSTEYLFDNGIDYEHD